MDKITQVFFILISLALFCFPTSMKASETFAVSDEADRVESLPGQPTSSHISQFSGYINVNKQNGRALFYWFFEALSQPSSKPLLLWLNGGPGCSSIGYGAAVELGPLKVNENGDGLFFNNFSWLKEANLLFVESPVGVGFSYTNTSSDLLKLEDEFAAEDAYSFLVNWLEKYPQFKNHDFFIAGESYGGHYVPQLAQLIFDKNNDPTINTKINLQGFIVGNPETDDFYDTKGLLEYAWSHSVISDEQYNTAKQACDFKALSWSNDCNNAMDVVYRTYREIDIYNIYAPICLLNQTSSPQSSYVNNKVVNYSRSKRIRIFSEGYDPCYSTNAEKYFNRIDVQASLHANINRGIANSSLKWNVCNGDTDGRVPVLGTRYCVEALGLPIKTPWRSWYHDHQVGGRLVEYEGVTLVTVRGAGHLVPLNKPSEALALVHSFLTGQDLPSQR